MTALDDHRSFKLYNDIKEALSDLYSENKIVPDPKSFDAAYENLTILANSYAINFSPDIFEAKKETATALKDFYKAILPLKEIPAAYENLPYFAKLLLSRTENISGCTDFIEQFNSKIEDFVWLVEQTLAEEMSQPKQSLDKKIPTAQQKNQPRESYVFALIEAYESISQKKATRASDNFKDKKHISPFDRFARKCIIAANPSFNNHDSIDSLLKRCLDKYRAMQK
jgi:hypothetical protein